MSHTTKLNNVVWESAFDYYGDGTMVNVAVTRDDGYHVWVSLDTRSTWNKAPCASIEWVVLSKYIDHLRAELSTTMADLEKAQAPVLETTLFETWQGEGGERALRAYLERAIQKCVSLGVSTAPPYMRAHDRARVALDALIEFLSEGETTVGNEPAKRVARSKGE